MFANQLSRVPVAVCRTIDLLKIARAAMAVVA